MPELPLNPSDFAAYFRYAPAALAVRECARLKAVRRRTLPAPILDIGCGDGLFARLAFPDRESWGIDINPSEIQRAQQTQSYNTLICGNICGVALPQRFFSSAIANCSLEHVPDIDGALRNIQRSLKPDAPFVMIVPTPDWHRWLMTSEVLEKLGMPWLAEYYGQFLNHLFAHIHLYDDAQWTERLDRAGFVVDETERIARRDVSWVFDMMLPPSAWGLLTKKLTGRWVAAPTLRPLTVNLVRRWIDAIGSLPETDEQRATEYMFVCRAKPEQP